MERNAAFAGSFYPSDKKKLEEMINSYLSKAQKTIAEKRKTHCIIAPHAGYIYSGQTAAYAFAALKKAKTFVIVSPNHTGNGKPISIFPAGTWETPLGKVKVNAELSEKIAKLLGTETDIEAHLGEHSIEVQLPFLQRLFGKEIEIVAITLATASLQELKEIGKAIATIAKGEDLAVIASSDFTHFEPKENAEKKDLAAIKMIEKLSISTFFEAVMSKNLSICGFGAIIAAMSYCQEKGYFKGGKLLHYDSSATATHDTASVVGYAAIGFY